MASINASRGWIRIEGSIITSAVGSTTDTGMGSRGMFLTKTEPAIYKAERAATR
jgi:hypothetical protein